MRHKRLTKAIQEHLLNGKKWPGLDRLDSKRARSASTIAIKIICIIESIDFVIWDRHPADSLSDCIEFETCGQDPPENNIATCTVFAHIVEQLSLTDVDSARHIVQLLNHTTTKQRNPSRSLERWQDCLADISGRGLEALFSNDVELAISIWTARHLSNDAVTNPDVAKLKRPFGIDFMERLVMHKADDFPDEFFSNVMKRLPWPSVCRLLEAIVYCSNPKGLDDLIKVPRFMEDSSMTMALLVARVSEQCNRKEPSIQSLDYLLYGGDFTRAAPISEFWSRSTLVHTFILMKRLENLNLTTWQFADICESKPGWEPFKFGFAHEVRDYQNKIAVSVRDALGDRAENVSRVVVGFLGQVEQSSK